MGDAVEDWEHTEQAPRSVEHRGARLLARAAVHESRARARSAPAAISTRTRPLRRQLEQGANNTILQTIYQSDVIGEADLIPGTVEDFYATVSDNFQRLESVTMESAMLTDSVRAEMLVMHGGHAKDLAGRSRCSISPATIEKHTITFPSPRSDVAAARDHVPHGAARADGRPRSRCTASGWSIA